MPDDRDVRRAAAARAVVRRARGAGRLGEQLAAARRDVGVQVGERRHLVAQRGDLADHVHALLPLRGRVELEHPGLRRVRVVRRVAVDALGGDAQAADVELLELSGAAARRSMPLGAQAPLLGAKLLDERRAAGSGSRGRGRSRAARCRRASIAASWNGGVIAPRLGRLAREQIGGAHQHADLDRRARPRRRGGAAAIAADRASWMPPANRIWHVGRDALRALVEQHAQHRAPTARSSCAGRRGRRTRAPRRRTRAPRRAGTGAAAPARGRAGRWRCLPPRARRAWSGRPPAISANGGRWACDDGELLGAQLGRARSRGCRRPTAARPASSAVRSSSVSTSGPRISASARNGSAPASATAAANSARSLTRVIGPCTIG